MFNKINSDGCNDLLTVSILHSEVFSANLTINIASPLLTFLPEHYFPELDSWDSCFFSVWTL